MKFTLVHLLLILLLFSCNKRDVTPEEDESTHVPSENETQILTWFDDQQLSNGLLESAENGNIVSLYDNALAAMVYMLRGDFTKSEKIFDFSSSPKLVGIVGKFCDLNFFISSNLFFKFILLESSFKQNSAFL